MSVDVPLNLTLPSKPGGGITDIVIVFGGWDAGINPLGNTELSEKGTGAGELLADLKALTPPPFHKIEFLALGGHLPGSAGVNAAKTLIVKSFDARGSLIVYGYSAGGTDALSLCREINTSMSRYGLTSRTFMNESAAGQKLEMGGEKTGKVVVDLLVTVDAAAGPVSRDINRVVAGCVKRNLNFYQTTPSTIYSRGTFNTAADSTFTTIENIDMTATAEHSTIDELSKPRAFEAIRAQLGIVTDTISPPAGAAYG